MNPETSSALESARRPDGRFGHQPLVEVLNVDLAPNEPSVELNEVLGQHVKSGGQTSPGGFTPVRNSSSSKPFGGVRFTPTSGGADGRFVSLRNDARVLVINSRQDFVNAFYAYPPEWGPNGTVGLDYEAVADDFDAIYVTNKGAHENRQPEQADMFGDLRDWNRGEVIVFSADAIDGSPGYDY